MADSLPHDLTAEEAVLAAALLDNTALNACLIAGLDPSDFYGDLNKQMYEAMLSLMEDGMDVTIPTVCYEMRQLGAKEEFLELDVTELVGKYLTAVGVETHIKIVKRCSLQRKIVSEASVIAQKAYAQEDPVSVASEGIRSLSRLAQQAGGGFDRMGLNSLLTFDQGVLTGIPVIDRYMRGLLPGKLTVAAAHSGAGKSLLAAQIARGVAQMGSGVAIFSMEMNGSEYETRMAHALSGIPSRLDGKYTEFEMAELRAGHRQLIDLPIHFKYKPRLSLGEIEAHARILKAEGVFLVVVDYLQLLQFKGTERQDLELGEATSTFKGLAGELDMHFLVLSQMNRGAAAEMRGKESVKGECLINPGLKFPLPFIESLKGSSAIEQDADHVLFLQRHPECIDHTEVVLAKNRGGADGRCVMIRQFDTSRFHRLKPDEITAAAHGDMVIYRSLMEDQGYY